MKYSKTHKIYKASNVTFDPNKIEAYSYDWWPFVKKIGRHIVFNNYNYSATTIKHQYKVRKLMNDLGLEITDILEAPRGLGEWDNARSWYNDRIDSLKTLIAKPGTRKAKNRERRSLIAEYKKKLKLIDKLEKIEQRNNV